MLAAVAAGLVGLSIVLALLVAPEDADQGISQRIFYFHVPIALTAYACFGWGAYKALLLLWKREERYDLESYVAIHQGTIFGALTLATGSIWAKASWGHWWVWDSNQLVLFLVLFLFYSAYFMLRFSIEEGPRRANVSAVYALFGVALIPVSFLAIRLAEDFIHPTTFTRDGPQMTGTMFFTFCVSWLAITALAYALYRVELVGKRLDANLRELREALVVSSGEKYVAAAYAVVFVTVLVYVVIIAAKLSRLERETAELAELARRRADAMAELLVVPALLAYGEAAVAYAGELRGPGLAGRLATWGVRIGWLAQTALLVGQAASSEGFPWGTWAGSLNLFVWLVVGAYLIWGCTPRYRLLGLAVMPVAAALLGLAWAGGGTALDESERSGAVLAIHVALMLAGFAGLTLAAGMAALYLWQERRLKRHERRVLRVRVPPLDGLDRLAARSILGSIVLLTLGIGVGAARFERGDFDAAMAVTLVIVAHYIALLALRHEGWRGRRAALLNLAGFALVAVVLPLTHFAS